MNMHRGTIRAIVLWGAVWGVAEASIGYILHVLPFPLGWAFWFPLAFFFMKGVRHRTGSNEAVLAAAFIAAAVKFVNIMMPGSIDRVVNPAVSILLESIGVYVLYKVIERRKCTLPVETAGIFAVSFLWRALYAGYIALLPDWMARISPVASPATAFDFLLTQSLVNAATIVLLIHVFHLLRSKISCKFQTQYTNRRGPARILQEFIPYGMFLASLVITRIT